MEEKITKYPQKKNRDRQTGELWITHGNLPITLDKWG